MQQQKPEVYRFIYKQKFAGQELQDSFTKSIFNHGEIEQTISNLYRDPHVFSVTYEKVKGK